MFKQVCLLTRKADLSPAEFEARYESGHARLGERLMPSARRYQRRYVRPEVSPITGAAIAIPFDCLTEIWWDSHEAFTAAMAAVGEGAARRELLDDEARLFASHANPVFGVDERETPMRGWRAGERLFKQLYLLKRRPGLDFDEFRHRYEEEHAVDGARRMPQARRYVRRYVQVERNPVAGAAIAPPFDVILEVWWGSRAESEEAVRAISANGQMQEIRDDREGIFASPHHPLFTVEECESEGYGWRDDGAAG